MIDDFQVYIGAMVAESQRRQECDAQRYADLDRETCQLCGAHGADKRSLFLDCNYAVHEVVPEAIDLRGCPTETHRKGYYLLLCKSCRGRLLGHLELWRNECVALRSLPKDHDGGIEDDDPDRTIPVRRNGATVMLTAEEYAQQESPRPPDLA